MTSPAAPRRFPWASLVIVVGACAISIAAWVGDAVRAGRIPTPDAQDAAASYVRAGWKAGDAVLVRPSWHEELWQRLVEGEAPNVPKAALVQGQRLDPMDLLRHQRAWVIGTFERPPRLPDVMVDGEAPVEEQDFGGGVSAALWQLRPMRVVARLSETLDRITSVVRRDPGGAVTKCPRNGRQFRCSQFSWRNPRVLPQDVYHREVEWVYFHPGPGATAVVLDWKVPQAAALVVRAGFNLYATRRAGGGETTLRVFVDGEQATEIVLAPHTYALGRAIIELPQGAGEHDVRFEASASDHNDRHLWLQADVVDRVPDAVREWAEGRDFPW